MKGLFLYSPLEGESKIAQQISVGGQAIVYETPHASLCSAAPPPGGS